jgi:type I restriction enzyme S subunit
MRKVPKLRFKEFSDEWEEKKLGEIGNKITLKNNSEKIKTVLTNSAEKGIVKQEDFFDKEITNEKNINNYYIVSKNDFVYNPRISKQAPYGPINKSNIDIGIVSPLYLVFNIKNENVNFLEKYFKSSYWYSYMYNIGNSGARSDRMNIGVNDFFNMPINIPSLQEQEKIANFLTSIDKKISLTEEKLELFREYKKGVMQKIFLQELRFKDSNGNDYPEWEEKRFDEVYTTVSNKEFQIKNSEILNIGKYRVIDQGKEKIAGYSNNELKVFKDIPIIVYGDHTTNIKFVDFNFILGGDGTKLLTAKNQRHLKFLYFALDNYNITPEGYKRYFSILKEIILYIPSSLEEQKKIADFLSSIDSKLKSIEKELEGLKEFKKGLLQQMFV